MSSHVFKEFLPPQEKVLGRSLSFFRNQMFASCKFFFIYLSDCVKEEKTLYSFSSFCISLTVEPVPVCRKTRRQKIRIFIACIKTHDIRGTFFAFLQWFLHVRVMTAKMYRLHDLSQIKFQFFFRFDDRKML